jgi:hypothetical protein
MEGSIIELTPPTVIAIDWTTFTPAVFHPDNIIIPATEEEEGNEEPTIRPGIIARPPFDIVVLTDCVFSVLLVKDLIRTIVSCCDSKTEVLCCHEIRDEVRLLF